VRGSQKGTFLRMFFASTHLQKVKAIIDRLDVEVIERMATLLAGFDRTDST
jgi:hypothetical protein